ncbi:hypothetical protein [Pinibacter soli]|uniref:Lipoprotein n=1 Tax=Pinibacter soli TaxID=3044211 RepID=A0ABT6RDM8_9BACT|nr:hypothetical protein [Pinibacter soli]MDI3320675.1 hypothetical protein [Pinibacter soli]
MIKENDKFKVIGVLIFFCLILFSCGYSKEDAEKYLPGKYFYEIPSGEIQTLKINSDFTFKQTIYSKNKKNVLYENIGKMYVDGDEIKFRNWLECYELADQKMLFKPYNAYATGIYWIKPKGDEGVQIVKFDQTNYIFKKRDLSN